MGAFRTCTWSRARPPAERIRTCGAAVEAGARYVIAGAVDKVNDRLRYNDQLFDGASGQELWSGRFDDDGVDPKAPGDLDAYDYYLRGASRYLRFTPADNEKARVVFEEGLKKYPNDGLLQVKLGWCFLARMWYQVSENPREDVERAWRQAQSAKAAPAQSHLATYLLHEQMASLYHITTATSPIRSTKRRPP